MRRERRTGSTHSAVQAPTRSRSEEVLRYLRDHVVNGDWPVGSRIPTEPELMETLHVGRSAVREAVQSLVALGVLEPQVSRGTFVRAQTPSGRLLSDFFGAFSAGELVAYRRAIEVQAAHDAALYAEPEHLETLRRALEVSDRPTTIDTDSEAYRRDPLAAMMNLPTPGQFHRGVVAAAQNRLFDSVYEGLLGLLQQMQRDGILRFGADAHAHVEDHRQIFAAIEAGDAEAAARLTAEHVDRDLIVSAPTPEPDETA